MGQFVYAFVFAGIMSANAVTTTNGVLAVIDWLACAWLFISGVILMVSYYTTDDTVQVRFYDED
jgi:hypothetical protein